MSKTCLTAGILLAVLAAGSTSWATSSVQVGDRMYFNGWHEGLMAGPLAVNPVSPSTFTVFSTFCVEPSAMLYVNGGPSYVYQVLTLAPPDGTPSHISWLYSGYRQGTLPDYADDDMHNNALQYGFWNSMGFSDAALEALGYEGVSQARADSFALGWDATPQGWGNGLNVKVATLRYVPNPGMVPQDILVLVAPEPPGPIPEPLTLVSALAAMSALGMYVRGRSQLPQS